MMSWTRCGRSDVRCQNCGHYLRTVVVSVSVGPTTLTCCARRLLGEQRAVELLTKQRDVVSRGGLAGNVLHARPAVLSPLPLRPHRVQDILRLLLLHSLSCCCACYSCVRCHCIACSWFPSSDLLRRLDVLVSGSVPGRVLDTVDARAPQGIAFDAFSRQARVRGRIPKRLDGATIFEPFPAPNPLTCAFGAYTGCR